MLKSHRTRLNLRANTTTGYDTEAYYDGHSLRKKGRSECGRVDYLSAILCSRHRVGHQTRPCKRCLARCDARRPPCTRANRRDVRHRNRQLSRMSSGWLVLRLSYAATLQATADEGSSAPTADYHELRQPSQLDPWHTAAPCKYADGRRSRNAD